MSELLINAPALHKLLTEQRDSVRVIDCRSQLQATEWGHGQYLAGHIPGAVHAHLEQDLSGPIIAGKTGRHPLPEPAVLAERFRQWGIGPTTTVVAYDDAGGVYASRLWWLLRWLGHERCQLLNGGLPAWIAAGFALRSGEETSAAQAFIGVLQAGQTVDAAALLRTEPDRVVIDVRGPARYAGREEPIDPVAGHIPGAINLPFSGNLAADGCFLEAAQLRERYLTVGDRAVSYCGSGVTACHAIFAMALAGLAPARLYAGSWSEWITDPARPIAVGENP